MDRTVEILKAASDPARIRILMALSEGELCVCQITEILGLAPSTVSKHMSILKHAGFVSSRKSGKWIYYKHSAVKNSSAEKNIMKILIDELSKNDQIVKDREKLKNILTKKQDELYGELCCDII